MTLIHYREKCLLMDNPTDSRQTLLELEWRQGSIISCQQLLAAANEHGIPIPELPDNPVAHIIIISMSCDVVYGDFEVLPNVEAQVCFLNPKAKNSNAKIIDPRKMVLLHDESKFDVSMNGAVSFNRAVLLHTRPTSKLLLDSLNSLLRWKVAQYNRLALPEELVNRIGNVLRDKKFQKWVKQYAHYFEGIFIELNSFEELKENETYALGIICVVNAAKLNDEVNIIELSSQFEELIIQPISEVEKVMLLNDTYDQEGLDAVISSNEFTYDMLKRFRRYPLDHFSLDPEQNDAPVSI